jgi:uncharacterized protein YggL (DUF469 family)
MLIEWLRPSIENRILEISEEYDQDDVNECLRKKFMDILIELNEKQPLGNAFYELEGLFNLNSFSAIDYSYRAGIKDVLMLAEIKQQL